MNMQDHSSIRRRVKLAFDISSFDFEVLKYLSMTLNLLHDVPLE